MNRRSLLKAAAGAVAAACGLKVAKASHLPNRMIYVEEAWKFGLCPCHVCDSAGNRIDKYVSGFNIHSGEVEIFAEDDDGKVLVRDGEVIRIVAMYPKPLQLVPTARKSRTMEVRYV